jgi:hypothetical protein
MVSTAIFTFSPEVHTIKPIHTPLQNAPTPSIPRSTRKTYDLGAIDKISRHMILRFVWWFPYKCNIDQLKQALGLTLAKYPVLSGRLERDLHKRKHPWDDENALSGGDPKEWFGMSSFKVVTDGDESGFALFRTATTELPLEDLVPSADASMIETAGTGTETGTGNHFQHRNPQTFSQHLLPHSPNTFFSYTEEPQKYTLASATYLESASSGNGAFSAIALSLPHLICDGSSAYHFMRDWSLFYKYLGSPETLMKGLNPKDGSEQLWTLSEKVVSDYFNDWKLGEGSAEKDAEEEKSLKMAKSNRVSDEAFESDWNAYRVVDSSWFADEYPQEGMESKGEEEDESEPKIDYRNQNAKENEVQTEQEQQKQSEQEQEKTQEEEIDAPTGQVLLFSDTFVSKLKTIVAASLSSSTSPSDFASSDDCICAWIVQMVMSLSVREKDIQAFFQRPINVRSHIGAGSNTIGNLIINMRVPIPRCEDPDSEKENEFVLSEYALKLRKHVQTLPWKQQLEFLATHQYKELFYNSDIFRAGNPDFVLSSWARYGFSFVEFETANGKLTNQVGLVEGKSLDTLHFDGEGFLGLGNLSQMIKIRGGYRLQIVLMKSWYKELYERMEKDIERIMAVT